VFHGRPAARIAAVNGVDHYENFPVASVLCPPALRPAIVAIYRFARTADDIADEGDAPAAQRLADLAEYRADLRAIYAGRPPGPRWPGVFGPLDLMRRRHDLPQPLLADLLDAFVQDVHNPAYPDRAALLDYCRRSADPIGRLLLHLYGLHDPAARRESDAICSALQLINFWQDLSRDLPRGRCYVPQSDQAGRPPLQAGHDTAETRALVRTLCDWARGLMLAGAPLVHRLPGRAGWELRLVVQGGLRILETIGRMDHAVLSRRPSLGAFDVIVMAWRALWMRR
jgi:squalene synthase HpnC